MEITLGEFFSIVVLSLTAFYIAKQTQLTKEQVGTTKELIKNSMKPIVDVAMIFDKEKGGTRFQFLNLSKIPASVLLTLDLSMDRTQKTGEEKDELLDSSPHLTGKEFIPVGVAMRATEADYLKKLTSITDKEIEIFLSLRVAPQFDKNNLLLLEDKKPYKFNHKKQEWIHTEFWNIPDQLYPFP